MLIRIYPENPNEKAIAQVVDILRRDGVIVYPTDSVYAFGCSLHSTRAIERIRTLTGKQGDDFSIICHDLSGIAAYARVDTPTFKLMKRNLPGPFTFLLSASNKVPDKFLNRKKTVGVRIPANGIPLAIVDENHLERVAACFHHTPDPREQFGKRLLLVVQRDYYGDVGISRCHGKWNYQDLNRTGPVPAWVRELPAAV